MKIVAKKGSSRLSESPNSHFGSKCGIVTPFEDISSKNISFWPYFLSFATLCILYRDLLQKTAGSCLSFEGAHGVVILLLGFCMVWLKRKEILNSRIAPAYILGASLTILGCLIFVTSKLKGTFMFEEISFILCLAGLVLLMLGYPFFRILWVPICYLALMFPVVNEGLGTFSYIFQLMTARIASFLITLAGVPVFQSSIVLELPCLTVVVAEICNGINHIMALVALSIPLAMFSQSSLAKRTLLIALAPFIGILANGTRVAVSSLLAGDGGSVHGPYDPFYVSFIFILGILLLVGMDFLLRKVPFSRSDKNALKPKTRSEAKFNSSTADMQAQTRKPVVVALILLLSAGVLVYFL